VDSFSCQSQRLSASDHWLQRVPAPTHLRHLVHHLPHLRHVRLHHHHLRHHLLLSRLVESAAESSRLHHARPPEARLEAPSCLSAELGNLFTALTHISHGTVLHTAASTRTAHASHLHSPAPAVRPHPILQTPAFGAHPARSFRYPPLVLRFVSLIIAELSLLRLTDCSERIIEEPTPAGWRSMRRDRR